MERYYDIQNSRSVFSSDVKMLQFLKELLLKDYKIFEVEQKAGQLIPYHTHNHKEIVILLEGRMRMIVEEDIIDLDEGDIVTIKPWAVHLSCFPFDQDATFYLCHPAKTKPYNLD